MISHVAAVAPYAGGIHGISNPRRGRRHRRIPTARAWAAGVAATMTRRTTMSAIATRAKEQCLRSDSRLGRPRTYLVQALGNWLKDAPQDQGRCIKTR